MTSTKLHLQLAVAALAAIITSSAACGSKSSGTPGAAGSSGTPGAAGSTGGAGPAGASGSTGLAGSGPAGAGVAGAGGAAGHTDGGADAAAGATGAAGSVADGGGAGAGALSAGPCSPFVKMDAPITKLTQTGCMDATTPTKMAAKVIPYEVNSPLWSDNANKDRGFALPANGKIHVKDCTATPADCPSGKQDDGKWVMPVGTVMVKSFGFDGKLVETRLLMHPDANTWNGYSYQWNEAQTEATVIPDDADPSLNNMRAKVSFNTGTHTVAWTFPYRFDCNVCHTMTSGGTLGMETAQMNRMVGTMNQIDKWKAAGTFETAPKTPYKAALVLPVSGQLGTASGTAEQRARSYLHANCSYCHRPDDDIVNWLDFRYDTALKDTGACAVAPMKGTVGVDGALILKPGDHAHSVIHLRMNAPFTGDKTRMPQLATYVVDAMGLGVVDAWIDGLTATACQ